MNKFILLIISVSIFTFQGLTAQNIKETRKEKKNGKLVLYLSPFNPLMIHCIKKVLLLNGKKLS